MRRKITIVKFKEEEWLVLLIDKTSYKFKVRVLDKTKSRVEALRLKRDYVFTLSRTREQLDKIHLDNVV